MRTLVLRRNARRGSVRTRWRRGSPRAKPSKGSTATRPCTCSRKPAQPGVGQTPLEPEGAEGEAVRRRFEQACRDCERRYERLKAQQAQQGRLEEIVHDAEQLVASSDLAAIKARWVPLQREMAQARGQATDVLQARFLQAASRLRARRLRSGRTERRSSASTSAGSTSFVRSSSARRTRKVRAPKDLERGLRSVRTALENLGSLPTRRDREEVTQRLRAVQVALQQRRLELRDLDEWHRWANLGVQETLCRRLEALRHVDAVPEGRAAVSRHHDGVETGQRSAEGPVRGAVAPIQGGSRRDPSAL